MALMRPWDEAERPVKGSRKIVHVDRYFSIATGHERFLVNGVEEFRSRAALERALRRSGAEWVGLSTLTYEYDLLGIDELGEMS